MRRIMTVIAAGLLLASAWSGVVSAQQFQKTYNVQVWSSHSCGECFG